MSKTLSLFSGVGGLDLGAAAAGLKVSLAVDRDVLALDVLRRALGTRTSQVDLADASTFERIAAAATDAQLVVGGPPCTAFSHAGFWIDDKRAGKDPAAGLIGSFVDVVSLVRPDAFLLENVPGLAFRTHDTFFRSLLNRARRAGYSVTWQVLNAADFGVAQARRRLFVVGVRGRRGFAFPQAFGFERTSRWAIADLPEHLNAPEPDERPHGRWSELIAHVPPGENYLVFTSERGHQDPIFRYRGRYWSFLLKLHPDRPAPTLPAQRVTYNGPFHWENRHLRAREMARLQGFPDWYPLTPDVSSARRHLGNAVPPVVAAAVLWELRRHIGDARTPDLPHALAVATDRTASVHDVMSAFDRYDATKEAA